MAALKSFFRTYQEGLAQFKTKVSAGIEELYARTIEQPIIDKGSTKQQIDPKKTQLDSLTACLFKSKLTLGNIVKVIDDQTM